MGDSTGVTTESVWGGGFLASLRALHPEREESKRR